MVCQEINIDQQNKQALEMNRRMRATEATALRRVNSFTDQRRLNIIRNRIRVYADKRRYVRANITAMRTQMKEVRMFIVERRDAKTLLPLIQRHANPG